nr:DUF2235 domain-containing protein [Massilia sp. JS1662]
MPLLQPTVAGLRFGPDQAEALHADVAPAVQKPSPIGNFALAVRQVELGPVTTCKQRLWFSFFFDGTGNNLYADEGLRKHSNVAKLFRVHKPIDKVNGVYSFYLQGVGTYFSEIGDDGGDLTGLSFGRKGTDRLEHAIKNFDASIKRHLDLANSPSNAISEINLSVFGFSRGAALARAFVNLFLKERCVRLGDTWVLKTGSWPLRVRFLGLFDTVASVGLPMSNNTTSKIGTMFSSLRYIVDDRLASYIETRPSSLAFSRNGVAGADPAPGMYDGHSDWGNMLDINPMVEEVRHFIAAHEIRNSFPVDSVSCLRKNGVSKPEHFYETVYPGVHSDVGGSYAPGEGGRATSPSENLGVIPLMHMYNYALAKGVPLRPVLQWADMHKADFSMNPDLLVTYNYYVKTLGTSTSLGELMNKNMSLYYAWRFRAIRLKSSGSKIESERILRWNAKFQKDQAVLNKEVDALKKRKEKAAQELDLLLQLRSIRSVNIHSLSNTESEPSPTAADIDLARKKLETAQDEFLKAKARLDALPNMSDLQNMLDFYDAQLMEDVKSIMGPLRERYPGMPAPNVLRRSLRPHYKALVKAYEDEFLHNKGMTDEKLIKFFDTYVHDSLAGFAKDATLPSDPRVVYLGGDEKYEYARIDGDVHKGDRQTETV